MTVPLSTEQELYKIRAILSLILAEAGDAVEVVQNASAVQVFTIPTGSTGMGVTPADLGGQYELVRVFSSMATYFPANTYMMAYVGHDSTYAMSYLYEKDDPGTLWSGGPLPTSGSFDFLLAHAMGCRRVQIVLSQAATGPLPVYIKGMHRSE